MKDINLLDNLDKTHFIGIGGSGMSGLASLLLDMGCPVSGSDIARGAVVQTLEEKGAQVFIGHSEEQVNDVGCVVVSSAISTHNPELVKARQLGLPILHRAELLAQLMRLKQGIAVAGTHGKTTTSSMLAHTINDLGLDPTAVIGGRMDGALAGSRLGHNSLMIVEADESDGSFMHLNPAVVVLTNVDKDHMDHYGTYDNIIKVFTEFSNKVPFYGHLCACVDNPGVELVLKQLNKKTITWGLKNPADISATNIQYSGFTTRFTPTLNGKQLPEVHLPFPGEYNVSNALGVLATCHALKIDLSLAIKSLSSFKGVTHRFTLLGETETLAVIDDYAHNPQKVESVLDGTRQSFPDKNIVVLFQPHRYSRMSLQLDEFATSFKSADSVVISPIYTAGETPIEGISPKSIAEIISKKSFLNHSEQVLYTDSLDDVVSTTQKAITQAPKEKTLLLCLGAGNIRQYGQKILDSYQGGD